MGYLQPDDYYPDSINTNGHLTVGGSVAGFMDVHDSDFFRVDISTPGTYQFTMTGIDTPGLWLINSSGVAMGCLDGTSGAVTATLTWLTWTAPITVYIQASGLHNNVVAGTGNYTLSLQTLSGGDDYAQDLTTAGYVTVGGTASGHLDILPRNVTGDGQYPPDHDWFAVNIATAGTYQFTVQPTSSGGMSPALTLRDGGGYSIQTNTTTGIITHTFSGATTVYMEVWGYHSTDIGNYVVSVQSPSNPADDFAANTSTTGYATVGGSSSGRIETAGDEDWFAVSVTGGQIYNFQLVGASSGGLSDPF